VLSGLILSNETFGIVLKEEKKLIGTISLYSNTMRKWKYARSIGFSLNYDYWGCGYTTEALKALIDYVFTKTDCQIIEIGHHVGNEGSKKVILNCGFKYDGTFPKFKKLYDGRVIDAVMYSLEKIDYERMNENE
jgi:RimJ/RimL family protein N-acetyltransferase